LTCVFENILGQSEVCASLRSDILQDLLPGSMLFEGPSFSAKLSTALELARTVSCDGEALWNCTCPQCARHRLLMHQDMMILGPKSFREELAIGVAMMENAPGPASRYFFIRAARKLARRFDQDLYGGEENKLSKVLPLLRSVLESIDACLPGENPDDLAAAKDARKLLPVCAKLESMLPATTPVFQIRSMEFWARLAPYGKRKTIIIEHADKMLDSSRNALLKILEEPPARSIFILTTTRRQAIIPTIVSRVRRYHFIQRTGAEAKAVIERIFRVKDSEYGNLGEYFASFRSSSSSGMMELSRNFVSALLLEAMQIHGFSYEKPISELAHSGSSIRAAIQAASSATSGFGNGDETSALTFPQFLDEAGIVFSRLLREEGAGIQTQRLSELFAKLARDALNRYTSFNLLPTALTERLAQAFVDSSEAGLQ